MVNSGNWLIGFVCALILLAVLEIGLAYEKGKKDGRNEYVENEKRLEKQIDYFNKKESEQEVMGREQRFKKMSAEFVQNLNEKMKQEGRKNKQ